MKEPRTPSRRIRGALVVGSIALSALVPATAHANPSQNGCENRNNNSYQKLLECVRLEGVREHQAALQAIADANGGTRADSTPGFLASLDYVESTMTDAGWDVQRVPFEYPASRTVLEQLTPVAARYLTGGFPGTGEGDVTGNVIPVDLNLTLPRDPVTSGCEAADFVGDWSGPADIALIQRGTCAFAAKALNAQAAGAEAVIIFNQGNTPAREGLIIGTLAPATATIPVVGASFDQGVALSASGSTAHVLVDFFIQQSFNIIADLPGKNETNVVMAGAHLDSVVAGPGINDNGSGSAALLEVAQQLGNFTPQNTVRFAWWGAEELGLIGSTQWVGQRTQAELDEIALYMNFDMIGSPNHIFMVYDADQSSFPPPAGVTIPEGSATIEDTFESYYTYAGVPYDDTQFSGRSDYQAFINRGIPSSGLFTGAEGIKSPAQAAIWGGTAGAQYDPCYHLACDTYANNNDTALEVNSDAVAFAVMTYAYSTETINGVVGRDVRGKDFPIPAPAGEQGTFQVGGGGGLHDDHGHAEPD